jgi:Fe-S cluster assembly iron-binding protein IscA
MAGHGLKRALNGNWRGGETKTEHGYLLVRVGTDHPLSDVRGYAYKHRLVAEAALGRPLRDDEAVWFKNGNRLDCDPDNLEVLTNAERRFRERKPGCNRRLPREPNRQAFCECGCGVSFPAFDAYGRPRRFVSGHNLRIDHGR